MSVRRSRSDSIALKRAILIAVVALLPAACNDSPTSELMPPDGNAVFENGVLVVRGDAAANEIEIAATPEGLLVTVDGRQTLFEQAIGSITVDTGEGDDDVSFRRTAAEDLELTVATGAGDDDVQIMLVEDDAGSWSGEAVSSTIDLETGPGADRTDIRWDTKGVPALEASLALNVDGTLLVPEVEDEVLVSFEAGDPDRPVIVGSVWNGKAPPDVGPGGDARSLSLAVALTADSTTMELKMLGGFGRDSVEVNADYSGVSLQQGRVTVDADVSGGDNYVGVYRVTGVRHTLSETRVIGGGGSNTIVMDDTMGGDAELDYDIALGDGDNQTSISFGDGLRGARPTTGQRNVTATYRSGGGTNGLVIDGHLVEPLASDVTADFGQGQGSLVGRYTLPQAPASDANGAQAVPSQVRVVVLAPGEADLDLQVDVPDPDPEDGVDEPGTIVARGNGLQSGRVDLFRLLGAPDQPAEPGAAPSPPDDEWSIELGDVVLSGAASLMASAGGEVRRLVYVQESVELMAGSSLDVALQGHSGNDAMLGHLLGVSGDGKLTFLADGAMGSDTAAILTRDLSTAGAGELSFEARGGDGDDLLGLQSPTGLQRIGPTSHLITGGGAYNQCFASTTVVVTGCTTREGITEPFLQILTELFGEILASEWEPSM